MFSVSTHVQPVSCAHVGIDTFLQIYYAPDLLRLIVNLNARAKVSRILSKLVASSLFAQLEIDV